MEVDRSRSVNSLNQRSCTSGTTLVEMNNRCSFASVAVLPREKVRRRVTKVVVAPMIVRLQRFRHVFTWRSCHGNDSRRREICQDRETSNVSTNARSFCNAS